MASDSRFGQMIDNLGDKLNEQQWYQQLKAKWEELDPQSRLYLRAALSAGGLLLVLALVVTSILKVHNLKKELAEKSDLLGMIQNANEELRRLKDSGASPPPAGQPGGNWPSFFDSTAANAGIEKGGLTVAGEKPGATGDISKETLFDLNVKHVSIKQVVRLAYYLENGGRPVKLRNLSIDTKADPAGYMDATLMVSGFTLVQNNK